LQVLLFGVLGIATGSLYGLVALGVVLTYRASGVLNFSAGAVGAVGAFVTYNLRDGSTHLPWLLALILGLASGAVLGALSRWLICGILRNASNVSKLVATLGILTLAEGVITLVWGGSTAPGAAPTLPNSLLPAGPSAVIHLFGVSSLIITKDRLIIIGIVMVLVGALRLVYSKTTFGLATSAVAENADAAAAGGLSPGRIELVNFVISGLLSAGAAILLAPIIGLDAATLSLIIVPAMAAALLGGFSSFSLTLAGAMLIGVLQSEISRYVTSANLSGLSDAVPVGIIVIVTIVGGRSRLARGDLVSKLPFPGPGWVPLVKVVGGAAAIAVVCVLVDAGWAGSIAVLFASAVLLLSVVVVTGYCGQLSLGQAALAGVGAWLTARLLLDGIPFELAIVLGMAITIPVGLVVAVPALRTRGVTLAVSTLALGALISSIVFNNASLTGGYEGLTIQNERFFGINVDPILHPVGYALLTVGCFVFAGLIVANVRRGRSGRRMLAVRGNERAAAALGIGVYGAKLYAFGLGSAIAALGGVLIAFQVNYLNLSQFNVLASITAVEYAVIGGIGWISGALIGAVGIPGAPLTYALSSVADIANWLVPLAGLGTIIVIAKAPDGLAANLSSQLKKRTAIGRRRILTLVERWNVTGDSAVVGGRQERASTPVRLEIEVRNLSVRFGGVRALDDVSFTIRSGEILGLIGPNGAGKTTLLDIITGFTRQTDGSVLLDGARIDSWSPERRARAGIGRSWQGVELFDGMTVRENLLVAADNQARSRYFSDLVHPGRLPRSTVVDDVVETLGLAEVMDKRTTTLSQGDARLVGIARAVAAEPGFLLLDEPAAGLDTHETQEFGRVIRMLAQRMGMGVVLIEHDVPLVTAICDRIVVLDFGHQIAMGTPEDIGRDQQVIDAYLGAEVEASPPRTAATATSAVTSNL
jgi:ABC-type branched-subunit amino acid transport system ATPase component/ABC-type branched-subunit amino acid transport system permease subunit